MLCLTCKSIKDDENKKSEVLSCFKCGLVCCVPKSSGNPPLSVKEDSGGGGWDEEGQKVIIYVLLLNENKYYVGKSHSFTNFIHRLKQHQTGVDSSAWTKKYGVIKPVKILTGQHPLDELKVTLQYMQLKGISNVRGANYVNIYLSESDHLEIKKLIFGSENRCFNCSSKDHFMDKCPYLIKRKGCELCGRINHSKENCISKKKKDGQIAVVHYVGKLLDGTVFDSSRYK